MSTRCFLLCLCLPCGLLAADPAKTNPPEKQTTPQTPTQVLQTGASSVALSEAQTDEGQNSIISCQFMLSSKTVISADKVAVSHFSKPDGQPFDKTLRFQASVIHSGPNPVIELSAPAEKVWPGFYQVSVNVGDEVVAVNLNRPAATMTSRATVTATRTLNWCDPPTLVPGRLVLRETSGKASLRRLDHSVTFEPDKDHRQTKTEVELEASGPDGKKLGSLSELIVPPGQDTTMFLQPTGEFPLGTTKGKLYLTSRTATASDIDFEVFTRRSPAYIWWLAVGGALVGWLLRTLLPQWQDWLKARTEASTTLQRLKESHDSVPDEPFGTAVQKAITALNAAITEDRTQAITDARNIAETALTEARSALEKRRTDLTTALKPFDEVLGRPWELPSRAKTALENARELFKLLNDLITKTEIAKAEHLHDQELQPKLIAIMTASAEWRSAAANYLAALVAHPPTMTDAGKTALTTGVAAWQPYATITNVVTVSDATMLATELDALYNARLKPVQHPFRSLKAEGLAVVARARSVMTTPLLDELQKMIEADAAAFEADLDDPADASRPAARRLAQADAWMKALTAVLKDGVDPAKVEDVKTQLRQSQWEQALQAVQPLVNEPPVGHGVFLGPAAADQSAINNDDTSLPAQDRSLRGQTHRMLGSLLPSLQGTVAERLELTRTSKLISFVASVVGAALFMGGVYVAWEPRWVGTPQDMLNIIVLACGFDVLAGSKLTDLLKAVSEAMKKTG